MQHARQQLDEQGYTVLESFIEPALLAELQTTVEDLFAAEGTAAGSEFKQEPGSRRLANLVNKGPVFRRLLEDQRLLQIVGHVLGDFKLSSLNARSANPRADCRQPLHADQGAVADERGFWVCNTVWMLTDFTPDNGAIRVVPGSHRWGQLPQQAMEDPNATHPDERLLTGRAGTVVVMNAHLWHGATANQTDEVRTAVHVFFVRRDKPQQQYQRQLLSPEVQAELRSAQRKLLALDDPLNDELCTTAGQQSGFLK